MKPSRSSLVPKWVPRGGPREALMRVRDRILPTLPSDLAARARSLPCFGLLWTDLGRGDGWRLDLRSVCRRVPISEKLGSRSCDPCPIADACHTAWRLFRREVDPVVFFRPGGRIQRWTSSQQMAPRATPYVARNRAVDELIRALAEGLGAPPFVAASSAREASAAVEAFGAPPIWIAASAKRLEVRAMLRRLATWRIQRNALIPSGSLGAAALRDLVPIVDLEHARAFGPWLLDLYGIDPANVAAWGRKWRAEAAHGLSV